MSIICDIICIFSNTCYQLCIPIIVDIVMDKVDIYDVGNGTGLNRTKELSSSHGPAKKRHLVKSKMLTWLRLLTRFLTNSWNVMGKSSGLIWEEVKNLDYQILSLIECGRKYGSDAKAYYWRIGFFTLWISPPKSVIRFSDIPPEHVDVCINK